MSQPSAPPIPVPPKRRRRWYFAGGFVLLLIAAPFTYFHAARWLRDRELEEIYREMDEEDPHWRWPDLIAQLPAPPPDERNAAVQVLRVSKLLAVPAGALPGKNGIRNAALTAEALAFHRNILNKAGAPAVEAARKLKDMPEGGIAIRATGNPLEEAQVHPNQWLNVMRILQHDAIMRSQQPNKDAAAESCQAILHAARALENYPTLMALLLGQAGQGLAVDAIEYTLGQGVVSEDRLHCLQGILFAMAARNMLHFTLRGERAAAQQIHMMVERGEIDGVYREVGFKGRIALLFTGRVISDFATDLRLQNEQVRASQLSDQAQIDALRGLEAKVKALQTGPTVFLPTAGATQSVSGKYHETIARLRSAVVALAAERYRLEHKTWPSGMDELVKSGFLKEVLKDPYDGQPLRWNCTETNIIIYSIGEKKIDDGGKLNAFNTRDNGLGFVLWAPRSRHMPPPEIEQPTKKKKK